MLETSALEISKNNRFIRGLTDERGTIAHDCSHPTAALILMLILPYFKNAPVLPDDIMTRRENVL